MNAAMIDRIVSLIPERVARLPSGVAFTCEAGACRYPERLAHLVELLSWMSPLYPITKDDQRVLGLRNAAGRPVHAADLDEDGLLEPDELLEPAGERDVAEEAEGIEAGDEIENADEIEQAEEVLA